MAQFPLPDGQWAELRESKKIPERLRRPVRFSALALQNTLPEDLKYKPTVAVEDAKGPEASEDIRNAFGTPPIDALVEAAGDSTVLATPGEDTFRVPTPEQQEAADAYNAVLIVSHTASWSYPEPVSVDSVLDLPGDAFDALLEEVQRLQGEAGDEESLASDPSKP